MDDATGRDNGKVLEGEVPKYVCTRSTEMVDDDAYVHVHTTNCTETESDLTIGSLERKKINQDKRLETFFLDSQSHNPT